MFFIFLRKEVRKITVEELDIIVQASVEGAVKEFKKLLPSIKKQLSGIQKEFDSIDVKNIKTSIDMKQVTKEVQKVKKQIKEAFDPNDISGMTINGKAFEIKTIKGYSTEVQKLTGHIKQLSKTNEEIIKPAINLNTIKTIPTQNTTATELEPSSNLNIMDMLRNKIQQVKPFIAQFKQSLNSGYSTKELELVEYKISEIEEKLEKAKTGEIKLNSKEIIQAEAELERLNNKKNKLNSGGQAGVFSQILSVIKKILPETSKLKKQFSGMTVGLKAGLGQILKYAGALSSLRSIYSTLNNSASTWLSSQNAGAKQLSANIEYMKYAMGSALAPVIQFVTNLVYQLMKAIQSVAYALTGVNIFAKASAKSYSSMANSANKAKEASKQLAGVHSDINNIQTNNSSNSGNGASYSPSFDLSQMDSPVSSIVEAIKNGDWYEVGSSIAEKLNSALASIPWQSIQETAGKIGTGIADSINGFVETADWKLVGNTIAQGINTAIIFANKFVKKLKFKEIGKALSDGLNSAIKGIEWGILADTLSSGITGIQEGIIEFIKNLGTQDAANAIIEFIMNIDWLTIAGNAVEIFLRAILTSLVVLPIQLGMALGDKLKEGIDNAVKSIQDNIKENGGNVVLGILEGIAEVGDTIGQWVVDHIFQPFIDAFKDIFRIHSPSTVMHEQGQYIMEGLFNGISSLVNKITEIWNTIKTKIKEGAEGAWNAVTTVFGNVSEWFRTQFTNAWQAVKNVFSSGGAIFDGIKDGILNGLKSVINSLISGINKVISVPFNSINSALKTIRNVSIVGAKPFSGLPTISVPQIPRLARGNVAYKETLAVFAEYSGASQNPEITTPQNILRETFNDVLEEHEWSNKQSSNVELKQIVFQFGSYRVAYEIEDLLKQARRQNGTATVTI